jgi:superfamily II DNA or RNA helicase
LDFSERFVGSSSEPSMHCAPMISVLAATTAFGKTVVAAALIAERRCSTLILVHRRELLGQRTERLKQFLSLGKASA